MDTPTSESSFPNQFISISDLFQASIDYYKKNWKLFAAIQAIPFGVSILSVLTAFISKSAGFVGFYVLVSMIVSSFAWLALIWVITREDTITWQESYKKGLTLAVPVAIAGIYAGLLTLGGFVLLILPGIYLAVCYSFVVSIVGHEGLKGMDALRKSKEYVKGYWWGVLGRGAVFGIVIGIIQMIFSAGSLVPQWGTISHSIMNGGEPEITSSPIFEMLGTAFTAFVATPLGMIYTFLMYKSLKSIKDN